MTDDQGQDLGTTAEHLGQLDSIGGSSSKEGGKVHITSCPSSSFFRHLLLT
jgi:hypothetical protein